MKPTLHKGKLTTWKDDRGFGFIQPDNGRKEVFLHISAVKGGGRRPQEGDTILYEQVSESNGKLRAAKASIQSVAPKTPTKQTKRRKNKLLKTVLGFLILPPIALLSLHFTGRRSPSPITSITQPGCVIKGNISHNTGNKVYHLPGMEDYDSTVIDLTGGERWFCTEDEAISNGWRKAPR